MQIDAGHNVPSEDFFLMKYLYVCVSSRQSQITSLAEAVLSLWCPLSCWLDAWWLGDRWPGDELVDPAEGGQVGHRRET